MEMLVVAEVVKPHGLRGEVCIESHADSPFLFDEVPCLYLAKKGQKPRRFVVRSSRKHKGRVLLTFKGVEDRDQAENLRGMEILVREADLPESGDDEVYMYELEGMSVELEDGTVVGTISNFILAPGQETWVISSAEGKEILFPAVEEFVLSVDLDAEKVVVEPPEGLLDIYLTEAGKKDNGKKKK
ncbi:ribosome maturation factor RimM [Maridesulfovibrio salexigens]|uniref:Ribosome maturation factor RimM n=1 Tax=Maridesulfovibrio salexigens (strain ATCC 14822 / DSM 2638 / NCIMB 8403 / VKM B-1763) TaxID=526222 RepID=C6BVQ3_MARSD|nr:ribosome maturation factor RimM [Maridesulfovibrio salexigens]ACS78267.1 16S rRNA processing protein RimM [Maridesulfovibrio salexigens DSM 2638]